MRWINSLAKQHEKHYVIAFIVVMVILLFYSEIEPDRYERRVVALELPPCDDCTKPQLRVWTVGNQNKLIMPRPLGNGPAPHID